MRFKTLAVCAAIVAGAAFASKQAPAAALPGAQGTHAATGAETIVEHVRRGRGHHGHRHRGHRHFGHHHHRRHFHHRHRHRHFHRHFRHRHFYQPYYYGYGRCTRVRHRCADYWGWGTWEFYQCVRDRGC